MNPPLWSVQTVAFILTGTAFAACALYAVFCWFQVVRNRLPGVSRWRPIGFTGATLNPRGRRYLHRYWASFGIGVGILLASDLVPRRHAATPTEVPDGVPRPDQQAVWEAVLAGYATHAVPSIGDSVRRALDVGDAGAVSAVPVVLLGRRDTAEAPYDRSWLDSIVARSLVASVCPTTGPGHCPGGQIRTYLELQDPDFVTLDTAVVMVYEQGIDWESCGRFRARVGADVTVAFRLARTPEGWIIVERKPSQGSAISC